MKTRKTFKRNQISIMIKANKTQYKVVVVVDDVEWGEDGFFLGRTTRRANCDDDDVTIFLLLYVTFNSSSVMGGDGWMRVYHCIEVRI